jgi:hypothetical protein
MLPDWNTVLHHDVEFRKLGFRRRCSQISLQHVTGFRPIRPGSGKTTVSSHFL